MKKTFLLFLFLPIINYAQSEFIHFGKSAIHLSYIHASNNISNGNAGGAAFSVNGVVDISLEYGKSTGNIDNGNFEFDAISTIATIAYNLTSKNSKTKLKFLAGVLSSSVETRREFYNTNKISDSFFLAGFNFSIKFIDNKDFSFIPSITNLITFQKERRTMAVGVDANLLVHLEEYYHLILTPSLGKDLSNSESSVSVGVTLGMMFTF